MRSRCFLFLAGVALLVGPAAGPGRLPGQSGGGGGQGGTGQGAADLRERWNQLTGGGGVWRRADLTDPHQQFLFDLVAHRVQATNGEITRKQFLAMNQAPPPGGESPKAADQGAPTPAPAPGGQPDGGQGIDPGARADAEFRSLDRDGNGLLDYHEMDDLLRAEREKWDANRDGFIDLNEYKGHAKALAQQEHPVGQPSGAGGERAARVRVGARGGGPPKDPSGADLPKNLPPWFKQYDGDKDGQVGLYEWRAARQDVPRFLAMDANGDGFLIPDEVLWSTGGKGATKE
jgi:hypothetical protein